MSRILVALALGACTDAPEPQPEPTEPCPDATPTVVLGTGSEAFVPLADGAALGMHFGPQGGYHVYGSLQTSGLEPGRASDPFGPDSPRVTFALTDALPDGGDRLLAGVADQPRLLAGDADAGLLLGQLVVITAVPDPPSLAGTEATFSASVTDRCGRVAEDARRVVLEVATD